jgi:hypothetical protein
MQTIVLVKVGDEHAGSFYIDENPIMGWAKIRDSFRMNPKIVEITEMDLLPVPGMLYIDGKFEKNGFEFIPNNVSINRHLFAHVVDNVFIVQQELKLESMQNFIAAYQSNPTFEVEDIYDDE